MAETILSFAKLTADMKGHGSLHDIFDVLVSYRETKLQELFNNNALSLQETFQFKFEHEEESANPADGTVSKILVKYELLTPHFKLVAGNAKLVFAVTGKVGVLDLPSEAKVVLTCPLRALQGKVTANGELEAAAKDLHSSNSNAAISFLKDEDSSATSMCGVSLDFKAATVEVEPSSLASLATDNIKKQFQKSEQKIFWLAGIKETKEASDVGQYYLRPTKFYFTIVEEDPKQSTEGATLCMWINVKDGKTSPDNPVVAFEPAGPRLPRSPIPLGATASIVFSHDVIMNHLLKPSVPGYEDTTGSDPSTRGISTKIDLGKPSIKIEDIYGTATRGLDHSHLYGFHFVFGDPSAQIFIDGTNGQPTLEWTSPEITTNWAWEHPTNRGEATSLQGEAHFTFTINMGGAWNISGRDISITWPIQTPCFSSTARVDDVADWKRLVFGESGDIPSELKNVQAPSLPVTTHKAPLNYFLTTNLLFPGHALFKPLNNNNIAGPRDLILLGHLETSTFAPMTVAPTPLQPLKGPSQFITDLVNPKHGLRAALMTFRIGKESAAKPSTNEDQFFEMITKQGYEEIAISRLEQIAATTLDAVLPVSKAPVNVLESNRSTVRFDATPYTTLFGLVSAFDLRPFGGRYKVAGYQKELLVNPQTGSVKWDDDKEIMPAATYDTTSAVNTVVWTSQGRTYTLHFISTNENSLWVLKFTGSVDPTPAEGPGFNGTQVVLDSQSRWSPTPADIFSFTSGGFGILTGCAGLLGLYFSYKWLKEDRKAVASSDETEMKERDTRRAEAVKILGEVRKLHEHVLTTFRAAYLSLIINETRQAVKNLDWSALGDTLPKDVKANIETGLEGLDAARVKTLLDNDKHGVHDATLDKIKANAKTTATDKVRTFLQTHIDAGLLDKLKPFQDAGWFTDVTLYKEISDAMDSHVEDKIKEMEKGGQPSFLNDAVTEKISEKHVTNLKKASDDLSKDIAKLDNTIKTSSAEVKKKQARANADKAKENSATDAAEKKRLHDAWEKLAGEIKKTTSDHDRAEKDRGNKDAEKKQHDKEAENEEGERKTREQREAAHHGQIFKKGGV